MKTLQRITTAKERAIAMQLLENGYTKGIARITQINEQNGYINYNIIKLAKISGKYNETLQTIDCNVYCTKTYSQKTNKQNIIDILKSYIGQKLKGKKILVDLTIVDNNIHLENTQITQINLSFFQEINYKHLIGNRRASKIKQEQYQNKTQIKQEQYQNKTQIKQEQYQNKTQIKQEQYQNKTGQFCNDIISSNLQSLQNTRIIEHQNTIYQNTIYQNTITNNSSVPSNYQSQTTPQAHPTNHITSTLNTMQIQNNILSTQNIQNIPTSTSNTTPPLNTQDDDTTSPTTVKQQISYSNAYKYMYQGLTLYEKIQYLQDSNTSGFAYRTIIDSLTRQQIQYIEQHTDIFNMEGTVTYLNLIPPVFTYAQFVQQYGTQILTDQQQMMNIYNTYLQQCAQ